MFSSTAEAIMAFDRGEIELQSRVKIRLATCPAEAPATRGLGEGSR